MNVIVVDELINRKCFIAYAHVFERSKFRSTKKNSDLLKIVTVHYLT